MATFYDCPSCQSGEHAGHVEHWGKRPEGIIDGDFCRCSGDCAERAEQRFDDLFRMVPREVLSTKAAALLRELESTDPNVREQAVQTINGLLDADPQRDPKEDS